MTSPTSLAAIPSLTGRELIQIGLGCNEIIFYFDQGVWIKSESAFTVRHAEGRRFMLDRPWSGAGDLVQLLGQQITRVGQVSETELDIELGTAWIIELRPNSRGFESFAVAWPGGLAGA